MTHYFYTSPKLKKTLLPLKFLESHRCWCMWAVFIFDKIKFLSLLHLSSSASPSTCCHYCQHHPTQTHQPKQRKYCILPSEIFWPPNTHTHTHTPSFFVSNCLNSPSLLPASPNSDPSAKTKKILHLTIWNFLTPKQSHSHSPSFFVSKCLNSQGLKLSLKQRNQWPYWWFQRFLAIVSLENPPSHCGSIFDS